MRRLPGPAFCRLSEGDHTPEALYELFRDWQRTHVWSAALSQVKNEGCSLVYANVSGLLWSCRLRTSMECAALSS
jgi:hypothetical protein